MSGYLSLRAITYRTHSLNLIHLELPPSFTACLIDFRFPLNVFPILFLLTQELFMFCSVQSLLSFSLSFFRPFLLSFFLSFLLSFLPSRFPCCRPLLSLGSLAVCALPPPDFPLPSSPSCSFSNTNLGAVQPGCLAQYEACVISSGALLEQIPQGLNRPCYLLSPLLCAMCT